MPKFKGTCFVRGILPYRDPAGNGSGKTSLPPERFIVRRSQCIGFERKLKLPSSVLEAESSSALEHVPVHS